MLLRIADAAAAAVTAAKQTDSGMCRQSVTVNGKVSLAIEISRSAGAL